VDLLSKKMGQQVVSPVMTLKQAVYLIVILRLLGYWSMNWSGAVAGMGGPWMIVWVLYSYLMKWKMSLSLMIPLLSLILFRRFPSFHSPPRLGS
jgi:hypothetical protein